MLTAAQPVLIDARACLLLQWSTSIASVLALVLLSIGRAVTLTFEEPGALEQVASLAASWFARYLRPSASAGSSTYD